MPAEGAVAPDEPRTVPRSQGYQVILTLLLSLNFGIVLFDRNALSFLMPFIQPELALNNTQVGMLTGALSLTWAAAALGVGALVDRYVTRKHMLILCTVLFSVCSFASGLAVSFLMLLATRLLMGLAEGGIMPVSQSLIATDVSPKHRGLAMGVAQGFGSSLFGSFVAPVVLVAFATAFGWRHAFFLAGAPGLLAALLMAWFIKSSDDRARGAARRPAEPGALRDIATQPNVMRCAVLGVLLVSYLVVCWAFMPLYLTQYRHHDPQTMGWLMGTLGISATIASTLVPALSDRFGRRPMMILMPLIGIVLPIGALFYTSSVWGLVAVFFIGWGITGVFPLFMATIPSESVAARHIPLALGWCMGTSEVLGGVISPILAGLAADRYGLTAPLWLLAFLAAAGFLVAFGLKETAPRVLQRT